MPFKTKGQKIAALKRRYTFSEAQVELHPQQNYVTTPSREIKPSGKKAWSAIPDDLSYIKRDLIKILIGALVIVAVQILLSLT